MSAWPESVAGSAAVAVLDRALLRGRLGHSLLFHGDNPALLEAAVFALADRLLNPPDTPKRFPVAKHPDFFALRPQGKMRVIKIGDAGHADDNARPPPRSRKRSPSAISSRTSTSRRRWAGTRSAWFSRRTG